MSVSILFDQQSKNDTSLNLYCNELNSSLVNADTLDATTVVFDTQDVKNLDAENLTVDTSFSLGLGLNTYSIPVVKGSEGQYLAVKNGIYSFQNRPISSIIYKQNAVSIDNIFGSWAEIANIINEKNGLVEVTVDSSLAQCVVSSNVDCKGLVVFKGLPLNLVMSELKFNNDVTLTNVAQFSDLRVKFNSTLQPNIIINSNYSFSITNGSFIIFETALVPPIFSGNSAFSVISVSNGAVINNGGLPLFNTGISSTLIMTFSDNFAGVSSYTNLITSTDVTGSLSLILDSSYNFAMFTNPGFIGVLNDMLVDKSLGVFYDDSILPAFGSSNVQGALDAVKESLTFHGFQAKYSGAGITVIPTASTQNICDVLELGSDYNIGTYTYTVPKTGTYELSYNITWLWTSTVNPASCRLDSAFRVTDGPTTFPGYIINEQYTSEVAKDFRGINTIIIMKHLNLGASIQISVANNSSANDMSIGSSYFNAKFLFD